MIGASRCGAVVVADDGPRTSECSSTAVAEAAHLSVSSILACAAVWGVESNAASHTTAATVSGFAMGLVIWAWLEH